MLNVISNVARRCKDKEIAKYMVASMEEYFKNGDYDEFVKRNYSYNPSKIIHNCLFKNYPQKPIDFGALTQQAKQAFTEKVDEIYWDNRYHYETLREMFGVFKEYPDLKKDILDAMHTHCKAPPQHKTEYYSYQDTQEGEQNAGIKSSEVMHGHPTDTTQQKENTVVRQAELGLSDSPERKE